MKNLNQEMVKLFVNNGWSYEIEDGYLPDAHYNEGHREYKNFTGGKISFYKKQKLQGQYSDGTTVEVFPTIGGYGVDFTIEDNSEGISFNFDEIEEILETAEETYKEHSEVLEEMN